MKKLIAIAALTVLTISNTGCCRGRLLGWLDSCGGYGYAQADPYYSYGQGCNQCGQGETYAPSSECSQCNGGSHEAYYNGESYDASAYGMDEYNTSVNSDDGFVVDYQWSDGDGTPAATPADVEVAPVPQS